MPVPRKILLTALITSITRWMPNEEEEDDEERVWANDLQAHSIGEQGQEEEAAAEEERDDNLPAGYTASASSLTLKLEGQSQRGFVILLY